MSCRVEMHGVLSPKYNQLPTNWRANRRIEKLTTNRKGHSSSNTEEEALVVLSGCPRSAPSFIRRFGGISPEDLTELQYTV